MFANSTVGAASVPELDAVLPDPSAGSFINRWLTPVTYSSPERLNLYSSSSIMSETYLSSQSLVRYLEQVNECSKNSLLPPVGPYLAMHDPHDVEVPLENPPEVHLSR